MTATYNPDEVDRLVREAREDDRRMTPGPWEVRGPHGFLMSAGDLSVHRHYETQAVTSLPDYGGNLPRIARTRNNLRAMADQLEAARAEILLLRPIVEAVANAAVDQTIGSVKVFTVGERVTAQYLPVAAAEAVRNR